MTAEEIFLAALEKVTPAERQAYLDGACGHDATLRDQVEGLLRSHQEAGSFLNAPLFEPAATVDQPFVEKPGTQIGPYKLLQQIGEGGFGVVFMAEQAEPVRRRVALKVIKPGMDTRQVIARFEAERQALAMMDHPNIARVMDAGSTASGRPYFVMELVRGVPITTFCDQNNLPIRERLSLFASVCGAIQHAHQKGIIHRDIKPSNVLVTAQDGAATVKVIDFGVAKAMGQQLTDKTLFTDFAQMIGTPLYMSPEQAELSSQDIDTRSDIYSLGVLLYELLTGSTPVDKEQMKQAAFDEIRRIIREEEPPKPSTRISSAEAAPSIAAQRHTEPARLARLVRGELDWIVMKALEKDRNRRYETAIAFARDVEHFLNDEQVAACPPSASYRLRKFARRNKAALATAAVIATALVLGIAVSTWQAVRATTAENLARGHLVSEKQATAREATARQDADQQRGEALRNFNDAQAQRKVAEENFAKARSAVDDYFIQVSESHLLKAAGLQPLRRELLEAALKFYADLTQQHSNDPELQTELAGAHYRVGRVHSELGSRNAALKSYGQAQKLYEALLTTSPDDVDLQLGLARCRFWQGKSQEAAGILEKLRARAPARTEIGRDLADAYNSLAVAADGAQKTAANAADRAQKAAEALAWHQKALSVRDLLVTGAPENLDDRHRLGVTLNNIAVLVSQQGRHSDALALYRRALDHGAFAFDRTPQNIAYGHLVATSHANIGKCEGRLGSSQSALDSYQRAIGVLKRLAQDNPAVPNLHAGLADNYRWLASYQRELGQSEELTRTMRLAQQVLERFPQTTATDLYNLACLHAVSSDLLGKDPIAASPQDLTEAQREAELAVETLGRAIAAGFSDLALIQTDPDLDCLRKRPPFQQLLTKLGETLKAQQVAKAEQEQAAKVAALASAAQGVSAESLQAGKALLAIRQGLAAKEPDSPERRAEVAATQHAVGLIQLGLGQQNEAAQSLAQAQAARQQLVTEVPLNLPYQADLAATRLALGDLDWKAGRLAEGVAHWNRALELLDSVVSSEPGNNRFVSQLAAAAAAIGDHYGEIGLWHEAAGHYAKAFAAQPSGNGYNWVTVGYLSLFAGDRETFRSVCTQALQRATGRIDPRLLSDLSGCLSLSPEAIVDRAKVIEMAQQVLAIEPDAGWRHYRIALAQYRAGDFAAALASLDSGELLPLRAMVHHQLGEPEKARQALERFDRQSEKVLSDTLAKDELKLSYYSWSQWLLLQLLRREAHELLDGQPLAAGPLQHLLLARAYARLGQKETSDAEFQAAVSEAPQDLPSLVGHVRMLDRLGRRDLAEASLDRLVQLQPNDPHVAIARARWHVDRGNIPAAEAAFAKAAALTADELNRFLAAGWWVSAEAPQGAGPLEPPAAVVAPTAEAVPPSKWRHVPTGESGRVDFQSVAEIKALPMAYAVNYVYSPVAKSVTLLVGGAERVRLEVNGELVYEGAGRTWDWGLVKAPALLRSGRNTFVATVPKPDHWHALVLRIADSPFDRGYLLAQLGLWDEALALWTPELEARPRNVPWIWEHYAGMLLAQGQSETYGRVCRLMLDQPLPNNWERNRVPAACALVPLDEAEAARLVGVIEKSGVSEPANVNWNRVLKCLVYYRAKRYQHVLGLLEKPESMPEWLQGEVYLLRALCQHALGNAGAARTDLKQADAWGAALFEPASSSTPWAPTFRKYNGVLEPVAFLILSREAHRLIAGDSPPHDRGVAELTGQVRAYLSAADKLTAAFDRAIMVEPEQPRHWLARFRARTEFGQGDVAERELEQIVQAAPTNPVAWLQRGRLKAELDRTEAAAVDLAKALALTPNADIYFGGPHRQLCAQIAQWPEVFDRVQKLHPEDETLWIGRAMWHAQHSRWREAAADFARVDESNLLYDDCWTYAGVQLLNGNPKEYQEITKRFIKRIDSSDMNPWVGLYLAKTCTLSPNSPAQQPQVMQWAEDGNTVEKHGLGPLGLGLAYYRAGEWERAIPVLQEATRDWRYGKLPVEKQQMELVLAMCDHHLEKTAAAARLKTACELLDQAVPYTPDDPFAIYPPNWVSLNILRREAEALILKPKRAAETKAK